jgi:hypothetical protein
MQWENIYLLKNMNESLSDLEFDSDRTWKPVTGGESHVALGLIMLVVIIQKPRLTSSIGITESFKDSSDFP